MKLTGIKSLIPFLNFLNGVSVSYTLAHYRDDSVMVTYTLLGQRVEVDFFDEHIEYSVFEGTEDVLDDQAKLFADIAEFIRE